MKIPEPEPVATTPSAEPKNKAKRAHEQDTFTDKDGVTVSTSVSYKVSSKAGRKRRDALAQKASPNSVPEPKSEPGECLEIITIQNVVNDDVIECEI